MSTGSTQQTVQDWIDARQAAEAIEYGIRAIKGYGVISEAGRWQTAQIIAACQAATRVTGALVSMDAGLLRTLQAAKRDAAAAVKAADADKKTAGTARQIALALAA